MFVIKRSGQKVPIRYDSITDRNIELAKGLNINVDVLSKNVIVSLKDCMTTSEIDDLASETAAYMSTYEPEYDILAAKICVSNHHKSTLSSFYETMKLLYNAVNPHTKKRCTIISDEFMEFIEKYKTELDQALIHENDYNYSYFGFKTLQKLYLQKIGKKVVERPQHMLMRVAVAIHFNYVKNDDLSPIFESYKEFSKGTFTHASPTLFNAGSKYGNLSSCFLLQMDDTMEHIYETNKRCAMISKYGGGIGIDITRVRAKGSPIHSTNGMSDGLVPMCQVLNSTARYSNQCFHPDTRVYTKEGPKKIKEIEINDLVLTIDGTYKPVMNVVVNKVDKDILVIKTKNHIEPVRVTKEHQIYTMGVSGTQIPVNETKFISADELTTNHLLAMPTIVESFVTQNEPTIDKEYTSLYSILLRYGSIKRIETPTHNVFNYKVTLDSDDLEAINFVDNYLYEHLGTNNLSNKQNSSLGKIIIEWKLEELDENENLLKQFPSILDLYPSKWGPNHVTHKRISKKYFLSNYQSQKELLISLFQNQDNILCYSLLAYDIIYLLNNFGTTFNVKTIPCDGYNIYQIKIVGTVYDQLKWNTITSIEETHYKGDVYDLSILDNNNYVVADLGVVHNSGKRKGSFAAYLQPWHPDVLDFLALRLNSPPEELRARDLFLAMWIPDIFMRRVEEDREWSLICPSVEPRLLDTYGEEFDKIYEEAEMNKKWTKQIKARDVWAAILDSQIESGLPYILYKDHINRKSNQKNIGIINSSNLCTEICEYTSPDSVAVCNLSSIALPKFVTGLSGPCIPVDNETVGTFDHTELGRIVKMIVRNLNHVVDVNFYPIPESKKNNLDYRPIGIGVQGLADVFAMLKLSWESKEALILNQQIFETIYYHSLEASHEIAMEEGPYSAFEGSPISQGILQFHMWNKQPSNLYNWESLIEKCKKGVRNSLLIAPMPTASTAQILGNNEACEAYTSNVYSRSTLAGDFVVINKHLYKDLKEIGLWTPQMVNKIIENNGSVQNIEEISQELKNIYKTVWEINQKTIIDMAADRGAFIDQSQSLNIFFEKPVYSKLTSMHFYGWKKGLKTGSYYIRSKPARDAVKFTILSAPEEKKGKEYTKNGKKYVCYDDVCTSCSS